MTISSRGSAASNSQGSSSTTEPFIKYEPHLVREFQETKPSNCKVSGRLLSICYSRLLFWSKYSKHLHNRKRYFWKSIRELAEEIAVSTKQVERALIVLVELGLILREKLQKHNYRQVWFYHLPKSPFTAGLEPDTETTTRDTSIGASNSTPATTPTHKDRDGFIPAPAPNQSRQAEVPIKPMQNVCIKQQKYIIKNTLQTIVDKCLFYGQVGIAEGQERRISAGIGFG
jgi:hypothetical protein